MIQVVIGTSHVRAILGHRRGTGFDAALGHALAPLVGRPVRQAGTPAALDGITVYELVREFHERLGRRLTGEADQVLEIQQEEMHQVAHEDYHLPQFQTGEAEAVNFLALHGVFPHGFIADEAGRTPVYLPDFSHGARFLGFLAEPVSRVTEGGAYQEISALLAEARALGNAGGVLPAALVKGAAALLESQGPHLATSDALEAVEAVAAGPVGAAPEAAFLLQRLRHALERTLASLERYAWGRIDQTIFQLHPAREWEYLDGLECHLCDSVRTVYERARRFCQPTWDRLREIREQFGQASLTAATRRGLEEQRKRLAARIERVRERQAGRGSARPAAAGEDDLGDLQESERQIEEELREGELSPRTRAALGAEMLDLSHRVPEAGSDEVLVIDAVVQGFVGLRSLRRDNRDVPTLGRHRLLSAAATRQGIAKPTVSGLFPIELWRQLDSPVHHFLLDAAERVGSQGCRPIYPDVPSPDESRDLSWQASLAEGDCGFDIDRHSAPLRRLGLEAAFRRREEQNQNLERLEEGQWAWDWTRAIAEFQAALYDNDIEQSLHLRSALDLYPLHKRVLGLVEYVFVPRLEALGLNGAASKLWTDGFTHSSRSASRLLPRNAGFLATLETEGAWLIVADEASRAGASQAMDLAQLLDELVSRLSSAPEIDPETVVLAPGSPAEQASQASRLARTGDAKSVCLALYLGKMAIMLRNAVEHGRDRVDRDRLVIDCRGYWEQERPEVMTRDRNYLPIPDWNVDCAGKVGWRHAARLPAALPAQANSLVLTPASLARCLTLLSLVLQAGDRHFPKTP
jgi:hypothetical protein